jgi:hypothetical protein
MAESITHETLHRGAKYFMDTGRAKSAPEAMGILRSFGLSIGVGPEVAASRDHQVALLSLVNCAHRTLLGGIEVFGVPHAPNLTRLARAESIDAAVEELGGTLAGKPHHGWPIAGVGTANECLNESYAWQLTWNGWRGGVTPLSRGLRLDEAPCGGLAPVLSAAACAAEAFLFHAGDHAMVGRRSSGLSLWNPGVDWLSPDDSEPAIAYLPSNLWLIGLGNLGQAYLWTLGCLNFARPADVELLLQDFDRIASSNISTSLLSSSAIVGQMKTRAAAAWVERQGFRCLLEERRFGRQTCRGPSEPAVALCGVDNTLARQHLERVGFEWVIETGLGAGPEAFKNFSLHTFPSSRSAATLWSENQMATRAQPLTLELIAQLPAYQTALYPDLDECGVAQLASRTVGVPFVGLTAATLAIAEVLRRLHGGMILEVLSGSSAVLEDIETVWRPSETYAFGHTDAARSPIG